MGRAGGLRGLLSFGVVHSMRWGCSAPLGPRSWGALLGGAHMLGKKKRGAKDRSLGSINRERRADEPLEDSKDCRILRKTRIPWLQSQERKASCEREGETLPDAGRRADEPKGPSADSVVCGSAVTGGSAQHPQCGGEYGEWTAVGGVCRRAGRV